ncbi:MAG TPA: hypothetical protein VI485_00615 [Vicinamibacterales bacterium]|nr:hypothetical protein [Vicinamibacterales bacterium]
MYSSNSFESIPLPQSLVSVPREVEPRVLFRVPTQLLQIRVALCAFDEQMDVFGHKAVRRNHEVIAGGCVRKLRANKFDVVGVFKVSAALEGAEREEIPVHTNVRELGQVLGIRRHGTLKCKGRTLALGLGSGPPEGGPYDPAPS